MSFGTWTTNDLANPQNNIESATIESRQVLRNDSVRTSPKVKSILNWDKMVLGKGKSLNWTV